MKNKGVNIYIKNYDSKKKILKQEWKLLKNIKTYILINNWNPLI